MRYINQKKVSYTGGDAARKFVEMLEKDIKIITIYSGEGDDIRDTRKTTI